MQEFLPIIKTTLLEWAQLALANPLFTVALVFTTALLAVIIGIIKSIPIKRRAAASEKARVELANSLAMAQQQATGLQERLVQRNQQISDTIQALAAGFALNEQPLPSGSEDLVSEDLWQQHGRIITQLADRLRTEQQARAELQQSFQAEIGKRVEKEALVDNLQNALAEKTLQIAGLEQQAAEILDKHVAQSARLAELEQQALKWSDTKKQLEQLEEKLAAKDVELSQLQKQGDAINEAEFTRPQIHAEAVAVAEPIQPQMQAELIEKPETVQPQIHQEPAKEPGLIQTQIQAGADQTVAIFPPENAAAMAEPGIQQTIVLPDWDYQPEASPALQAEVAPVKESASGVAGKFKSLFGKPKQSTAVKEAEEEKTAASSHESDVAATASSQLGKIKNLLGLSRSSAEVAETEPAETQRDAETIRSEPAGASEASESSAKNPMKKIKNLFSTAK
jgi:hypothetical protein